MTNAKSRGAVWLEKLAPAGVPFLPLIDSVKAVEQDGVIYVAVVPDPNNHYPRALSLIHI